jgi:hypothetical protein
MSAAEGRFSAPIATSWAWTAFSRASKARVIAPLNERVLEQVLGELADGVLARLREARAQAVAGGVVRHGANATVRGAPYARLEALSRELVMREFARDQRL